MITLLFTGCSDNEHVVTTWQTKLQEQQRFFLMAMPVVSKKKILAHTCALVPSETTFTWSIFFATKRDQQYSTWSWVLLITFCCKKSIRANVVSEGTNAQVCAKILLVDTAGAAVKKIFFAPGVLFAALLPCAHYLSSVWTSKQSWQFKAWERLNGMTSLYIAIFCWSPGQSWGNCSNVQGSGECS